METPDVQDLIRRGAVFYIAHSGGKDSQAMYARIHRRVPHERIVVVHADLGRIEWEGVQDHIRATIAHELNVVRANKTFFDMVRHFGCPGDIANGRRERPELYEEYRRLERETGWTLFPGQSLAERAAEGKALDRTQRRGGAA